jgi:hypothetical protein
VNTIRPSTSFRTICRAIGGCFRSNPRHSSAFVCKHGLEVPDAERHDARPIEFGQLRAERLMSSFLIADREAIRRSLARPLERRRRDVRK